MSECKTEREREREWDAERRGQLMALVMIVTPSSLSRVNVTSTNQSIGPQRGNFRKLNGRIINSAKQRPTHQERGNVLFCRSLLFVCSLINLLSINETVEMINFNVNWTLAQVPIFPSPKWQVGVIAFTHTHKHTFTLGKTRGKGLQKDYLEKWGHLLSFRRFWSFPAKHWSQTEVYQQ